MAHDWIKIRTDLYRDPKVSVIADILLDADSELSKYINQNMQRNMTVTRNVMRNVTVGALVSVWGVLRHRGKRDNDDLVIKCCTISIIDDLADLPGFGFAMEAVGWVEESAECLIFPRFFEEFNVDPAEDKKTQNAERQRKYRERKKEEVASESNALRNVTVTSQSNAREEKRREETITPPKRSVEELPSPDFIPIELWDEFMVIRKKLKAQNTKLAINSLIKSLTKFRDMGYDPSEIVIKSITNSWKDVFQPKEPPQAKQPDWQRKML